MATYDLVAAPGSIAVSGQATAFVFVPVMYVTGASFASTPNIQYTLPDEIIVRGQGFATSASVHGGSVVSGAGFASSIAATVIPNNEFFVSGAGFKTTFGSSSISDAQISVRGRGFKTWASIHGGSIATGNGFQTATAITAIGNESASVTGSSFKTTFVSSAFSNTGIYARGGGFSSILRRSVVRGSGFATITRLSFEFDANYAQAFVMNLNTNEVTRYTNYPFIHVARVGNEEYGFALDGIYRLNGPLDGLTKVNGQITTKDTDFNTQDFDGFQSKNVPLLYANTDNTIKVTAIVDGAAMPRQTSQFDGRKTKLARGARGRYWAMKVENITKLQGLEFLPEKLQRRVK